MMKTREDNDVNYCIGVAYTEIEIEWSRQLKDVIDINVMNNSRMLLT